MRRRDLVIYTRFSSDMQRTESCDDQEREVRKWLAQRGIEFTGEVIVIRDEATSGTRSDREGFQKLLEMIQAGQVAILAVDDQSRLTRGDNALSLIQDLVYHGGRFLSTSENIDTNESGWQIRVKIGEITHGETVRGLSAKVHRGQEGRVLADGSAGDFPYGYESYYLDDDWQQQLARRGPKPKKGIRICEDEAYWVREIFAWFVEGRSIGEIARKLTKQQVPKGRRATSRGWHPQQVRNILTNEKYIGLWRWGETKIQRDSQGRKKQIPVPVDQIVVRERGYLRIIAPEVWARAVARLEQYLDRYGLKPGQLQRGPKPPTNPTTHYPRSLLGGVLRCGKCGQTLWYKTNGNRRYYQCSETACNRCDQTLQVRAELAEEAVLAAITRRIAGWQEWIREVAIQLREILQSKAETLPIERTRLEQRLTVVQKQHGNLIDTLAEGGKASSGITARVVELEAEQQCLETRLQALARPELENMELPTEEWIREQLVDWHRDLADHPKAARAIREAIERIEVRAVIPLGKRRGYPELVLHFQSWELLRKILAERLPPSVGMFLPETLGAARDETEVLALGEPTTMDRLAPQIAEWRKEGITWKEIVSRTGMDLNRVWIAHNRYVQAQQSA